MAKGYVAREPKLRNIVGSHWRCFAEDQVALNGTEILGTVYIGFASYMNRGQIRGYSEIGRYCSIGRDVSVGLGRHDLTRTSTSPFFEFASTEVPYSGFASADPVRRTVIGNDVWIGDGVRINTGVTVGDGAVIATGSVVSRDVAPYSVVGGIPAKLLRWRFERELRHALAQSEWWRYSPDQLKELLSASPDESVQLLAAASARLDRYPTTYRGISPQDLIR